jgi:hypothetical protein
VMAESGRGGDSRELHSKVPECRSGSCSRPPPRRCFFRACVLQRSLGSGFSLLQYRARRERRNRLKDVGAGMPVCSPKHAITAH